MRPLLGSCLFAIASALYETQFPLRSEQVEGSKAGLKGRFLHITDLHPDFHYKTGASFSDFCHRGSGDAGVYGSPGSGCDSPKKLINETFRWISDNLKDEIDFVIWTGDSARHDLDSDIPRSKKEVTGLNREMINHFLEVFGPDATGQTSPIPIVPTIGNNDILPHNIFRPGPNEYTQAYLSLWRPFIPEEQRHSFSRGAWFWVEVIPRQLAVFSLNTLYFFDSNAAVDGCADKNEPGYEQMDWLRIQLGFIRQRKMKAIIIGHVPPARTESKQLWDETCWQKYTLWVHRYRDVVIGSMYGHMDTDHFFMQDIDDVRLKERSMQPKIKGGGKVKLMGKEEYLLDLRQQWSEIQKPDVNAYKKDHKKLLMDWMSKYSLTLVSPSIIPATYPSLRVFSYNATLASVIQESPSPIGLEYQPDDDEDMWMIGDIDSGFSLSQTSPETDIDFDDIDASKKKRKGKKKKKKGKKRQHFKAPKEPSKNSPPGPGYSPQFLSWLGYTQFYCNITQANALPDNKTAVQFVMEYDTQNDRIYRMDDLTVLSYLKLAHRIGNKSPEGDDLLHDGELETPASAINSGNRSSLFQQGQKDEFGLLDKKKKKGRKTANKVWFNFAKRAFVGFRSDEDIHEQFGSQD